MGNSQRFSLAELTIYNSDADELALKRHPRMEDDFSGHFGYNNNDQKDAPFWRRRIAFPFLHLAALIGGVFVGACLLTALTFAACSCVKKRRLRHKRAAKAADSARLEAIKRESVLASGHHGLHHHLTLGQNQVIFKHHTLPHELGSERVSERANKQRSAANE